LYIMQTRRGFLKQASLGALSLPLLGAGVDTPAAPLVVSTWNFGMQANVPAWQIIQSGGRALDAVEAGVKIPEADADNMSVGYGGLPDRDGRVTLDACIMDEKSRCGSVAALEHIMHPISVARAVMEKTPHVMLVGDGALQFALEQGFQKQNLLTPKAEAAWKEWLKTASYKPVINIESKIGGQTPMPGGPDNHDTIGMIALDTHNHLSGACTTSGMAFKLHGRVGDSPIIGAGLYVDDEIGAATCTGLGEEVIRIVGSFLVVELMRQGNSPAQACKKAVQRILSKNGARAKEMQIGFIAINKKGQYGGYALQKGFQYAVTDAKGSRLIDCETWYR
jgi:N4-(beta-N-acetylglucosaminyl)-L-asparaginase